jgi:hypothetical protein
MVRVLVSVTQRHHVLALLSEFDSTADSCGFFVSISRICAVFFFTMYISMHPVRKHGADFGRSVLPR